MGRPKRLVIKARASACSPSQTEPCDLKGSSGLGKRKCAAWDDNFMTQYSPPDPFHPLPTEFPFAQRTRMDETGMVGVAGMEIGSVLVRASPSLSLIGGPSSTRYCRHGRTPADCGRRPSWSTLGSFHLRSAPGWMKRVWWVWPAWRSVLSWCERARH